ncbi:HupE/UreJ family protein [Cognatishimia sp. MH4019]|uniref:HupE/UreJ family protein n=1 Tax=Cognatishimia sp. MH4019 TaxID=2854030 RepID=UPI001CD70677|nr:HupE/UreJ family protein [Cognatishimia sp. MH4019]
MSMLLSWATLSQAHEVRPAVADIIVGDTAAEVEMRLTLEPLVADMDLNGLADTDNSPAAADYDRLRALEPAALEALFREGWPGIASDITMTVGETQVTPELGEITISPEPDLELPRDATISFRIDLPEGDAPVVMGWASEYGPLVVRQGEGEGAYTAYLTQGAVTEPMPREGVAQVSAMAAFVDYLIIGFEHIIPKGLDHILFVLGLFFFSLAIRPLLIQVTTFTLAHTITLAMATLGVVTVPTSIVEPLIALSIVYIAVENVIGGSITWRRTAVIFAFGLLHGLGFASVLGDIGLDPARFISGLIAFNIGVEFGQLAVIAIAFVLIGIPFGKKPWYRAYIAVPASVAIGLVGAYWTIERVFF